MKYLPAYYLGTDFNDDYLREVDELLETYPASDTAQLDLTAGTIPDALSGQSFDYVLCLDVIEHIEDHVTAMRNVHTIVNEAKAEFLFLRVPALQWIYGSADQAIGHFRRYSASSLRSLVESCGFRIEKLQHQNPLGILPWFINGRIAKRSLAASRNESRVFDAVVPVLRLAERFVRPPIGLSLYCICRPLGSAT